MIDFGMRTRTVRWQREQRGPCTWPARVICKLIPFPWWWEICLLFGFVAFFFAMFWLIVY